MTAEQLHTENERLHALLADACTVLDEIAQIARHSAAEPFAVLVGAGAQACLDRIKQG